MHEIIMGSFFDELEKIAGVEAAKGLSKIWPLVKGHWKMPAAAAVGAGTYAKGKQIKRRHDIGKMVEEAQARRGE